MKPTLGDNARHPFRPPPAERHVWAVNEVLSPEDALRHRQAIKAGTGTSMERQQAGVLITTALLLASSTRCKACVDSLVGTAYRLAQVEEQ